MNGFYDNRELSWIKFNLRVLNEAVDKKTPAFEKLRFLAISTSNLDEFYMVRVGSLMDRICIGDKAADDKTGYTPDKQLDLIFKKTKEFYNHKKEVYDFVTDELKNCNIKIHNPKNLFDGKAEVLKKQFERLVKPLLSVQVIDFKNPFPHLENKAVYCALHLTKKDKSYLGLIFKSNTLENLIPLNQKESFDFVLTDDAICEYASEFFSGYKIQDICKLRVTRNADLELLENEFQGEFDYRNNMKRIIKKRQRLSPVRIEVSKRISKEFKKLILNKQSSDILLVNPNPLSFDFVGELEKILPKELLNRYSFSALQAPLPEWYQNNISVMKKVREKDIFLNYPYDNIKIFLKFLDEAAENKNVTSIKITLYRVNKNSKVIDSLIKAAENGKDVLAVVELRARFDEENNINYSEILENAGVRVLYGPENYKVHSKLCLVTLRKKDGVEYFTQCGTGNYNEKTACLYTDMNIITNDYTIGNDAKRFFDNISSGNVNDTYDKLISSPDNIEKSLIKLIDDEITIHKRAGNGRIIIKINSLTEKSMIDKLIEAAQNGVKVNLIVRGICCFIPSDGEVKNNVNIVSVVGKYLEHSRVYYFYHDGMEKIYISSADLMTRNLRKRVEIACPVEDKDAKEKVIRCLETILNDDVKGRYMDCSGEYFLKENINDINSQLILFEESVVEKQKKSAKTNKKNKLNYLKWLFRKPD